MVASLHQLSKELFKNLNNFQDGKPKPTTTLNDAEINYLGDLIEDYPEVIDKVVVSIGYFVGDKYDVSETILILAHDIPNISLIVFNVYYSHIADEIITNTEQTINIGNITKYTVETLLLSNIISVYDCSDMIVQNTLDTSIQLLQANTVVVKRGKNPENNTLSCCC